MKNIAFFVISITMTFSAAHANQYSCTGAQSTSGQVTLNCNDDACSLSGTLSDQSVSPSKIDFDTCTSDRRANSARAHGYVYFDVQAAAGCWANYFRLSPQLVKTGTGPAAIVKTSGGDMHDSSGYQYLNLNCR